jgi:hypothetical protein
MLAKWTFTWSFTTAMSAPLNSIETTIALKSCRLVTGCCLSPIHHGNPPPA